MDTEFSRTIKARGEKVTGRIMKMPDGRHAAEITSTTKDTGEAVLWSRIFKTDDSIATMTGRLVGMFDHFVACRTGRGLETRPKD